MPTIPKLKHIKKQYPVYNQSTEYYNTKEWKNLRHAHLLAHPLCERCLSQGRVTPAVHVHHIKPFLLGQNRPERLKLLLDPNNLMSVCVSCHQQLHKE